MDFLPVLLMAAIPGFGNLLGGITSEFVPVSPRTLSLMLHTAAGIVLAVVGVELMPQVLGVGPSWLPIIALLCGGLFFILMEELIRIIQAKASLASSSSSLLIFIGVSIDLFSDGIMIGTGSTISGDLGLLLALSQAPADFPEGFSVIATFRRDGLARKLRLLLSLAFLIPIFAGASIGYLALQGAPPLYKLTILAFTAGILLTTVVEEMVRRAHEEKEPRLAALFLVGGFALFILLSAYLETFLKEVR